MAGSGFFDRQARARRNTGWLVMLFTAAVMLITLAVCVVGYVTTRSESTALSFPQWLLSQHGLVTALAVVMLIGAGSLIRWLDLAGGGESVANMMNARLIDPSTRDHDEHQLRNIVEEMAIASGVPVPQLYVMDHESSINAFVAGYSPTEAVMVVTHGALIHLNRDELQGIIGHEFSHILNGDMRLNVRLIALLAGILMIGQIGLFLLSGSQRHSVRSSRRGKEQGLAVALGLALAGIGYIGVFFGRLIQAAVSRQREMLADASSVQFTRNPEGIGGALYKIGLKSSYLETTGHASDVNHMCFGESARMQFSSLLASHPPVEERINAIQPGLLARLRSRLRDTTTAANTYFDGQECPVTAPGFASTGLHAISDPFSETSPMAGSKPYSRLAGTVSRSGEQYAQGLLKQLPATFRSLLYTRSGAVQLCYALLTYHLDPEKRAARLNKIEAIPPFKPEPHLLEKLLPTLRAFAGAINFPALELATPALKKLDPEEAGNLIQQVYRLIREDGRLSLFEFGLASFLQRHLSTGAARVTPVRYRSYKGVGKSLHLLFSVTARASTTSPEHTQQLYREAMAGFIEGKAEELPESGSVSVGDLRDALSQLNQLSPLLKPAVIDACGHCILSDRKVSPREYDILRLVADQLDCPMPPLAQAD